MSTASTKRMGPLIESLQENLSRGVSEATTYHRQPSEWCSE